MPEEMHSAYTFPEIQYSDSARARARVQCARSESELEIG